MQTNHVLAIYEQWLIKKKVMLGMWFKKWSPSEAPGFGGLGKAAIRAHWFSFDIGLLGISGICLYISLQESFVRQTRCPVQPAEFLNWNCWLRFKRWLRSQGGDAGFGVNSSFTEKRGNLVVASFLLENLDRSMAQTSTVLPLAFFGNYELNMMAVVRLKMESTLGFQVLKCLEI